MRGTDSCYDNCLMLSPAGKKMCYVSRKKMGFYLKNGLAEVVTEKPAVFKLNFEPGGPGNVILRENKCCVCGVAKDLTSHHVVPSCFRKHFPAVMKEHLCCEILPLCVKHHMEYEEQAWRFKGLLAKLYKIPLDGWPGPKTDEARACRYLKTLHKHGHKIPDPAKAKMRGLIDKHLAKIGMTEEEYMAALGRSRNGLGYRTYGEMVVERFKDDLESHMDFIILWRTHFVEVMNPQHMPADWDVSMRYVQDGQFVDKLAKFYPV